jgi:hypothetical protein
MRKLLSVSPSLVVVAVLAFVLIRTGGSEAAGEKAGKGGLIAHNVYFSLKDNSPTETKKLVDACKKYLSGHPGEVFFAAGTLVKELDRPVNDRDFDVALHIVFKDRAAHDKYQDAPRHKQFIDENRANWKKVRVFDSVVQP